MYIYIVITLYRYTVIPLYRYTVIPLYRYTVIPLYRYTVIPLYRHTVIPLASERPMYKGMLNTQVHNYYLETSSLNLFYVSLFVKFNANPTLVPSFQNSHITGYGRPEFCCFHPN